MERDPGSIVDRCAIARLKCEHKVDQGSSLEAYADGQADLRKRFPDIPWNLLAEMSYGLNALIWGAESRIRQGQLDDDMEAAGHAAILTRNINSVRVTLGNLINTLTGCGIIEQKADHVSEKGNR